MKRVNTKLGDIFFAKVDGNYKKYFQYIANDPNQLNSDVIRAFKKEYPLDSTPILTEVIEGEIDFYVHCSTKHGVKLGLWEKVGNTSKLVMLDNILFRDTNDYGSKPGEQMRVSKNWHIWKIADKEFTAVGKLKGEYLNAYVGLVINPYGIIELLKGNKYPINYPEY